MKVYLWIPEFDEHRYFWQLVLTDGKGNTYWNDDMMPSYHKFYEKMKCLSGGEFYYIGEL